LYIADIEEAVSKIAAEPFNAETFPYDFIAAYDAPPATVTRIRNGTQNATDIDGAVLWRQKLHLHVCALGEVEPSVQRLAASRATERQKVQFLLATDGVEVAVRDLRADDANFFPFEEFGNHFGFFLPLAGYSRYKAAEENPVDVKAANRLSRLYDALIAENPEWAGDDKRHAMNTFMTRLIFCMFAEDTGIFAENLFAKTIHKHGGHAGEEMVHVLTALFTAMSKRPEDRTGLPDWADKFPWVNGGLFTSDIEVPRFNRTAYRTLTEAAGLRWNEINADIFGSMIQVIVDPNHRHETGMHYTSVPNILKALDPLFLDDLRAEAGKPALADASREKARLKSLLNRLSKIRVFDPACGSGNFLVIAYQELRKIERQVLDRLQLITGQAPGIWSHIELHNFYGIEVSDFAAETAKLSLWIAKFQMDRAHRDLFGTAPPALPLSDSGSIVCENSLRVDWLSVCPPPMVERNRQKKLNLATNIDAYGTEVVHDDEVSTFIVGNPPYLGFNFQSVEQKAEVDSLFRGRAATWKSLDYVACWFLKGSDYCRAEPGTSCAFVATNSICQGQQVPMLWPVVLAGGVRISFAHLSFKWSNSAARAAAVMCIIVGLDTKSNGSAYLIDENHSRTVGQISPYLTDGPTLYVEKRSQPLSELPAMIWGNKPTDGGHLLLSPLEREQIISAYPHAARFIHRFVGSDECINGIDRYCIWVSDADRSEAEKIPEFARRFGAVAEFRSASVAAQTRPAAAFPHRFRQIQAVSRESTIVVPQVSSERRRYLPVDYLSSTTIISNLAFALYDAPLWTLAIIASRLHLLWIETVCGKLETRFRYSNTMGWHTFPIPSLNGADRDRLTASAESILIARAEAGGTIADLYDPDTMPANLLAAHRTNDEIIERIYTDRQFRSDADRVDHLFRRFARMIAAERGEIVQPEFDLLSEDQRA
jgi:hypothetical protein